MEEGGQAQEQEQEQRFPCRFCKKSFVTGKSLGGHMRGHLALISAQKAQGSDNGGFLKQTQMNFTEEDEEEKNEFSSMGCCSEDGYGLRENPKKTWRASGLKPKQNVNEKNEKINSCKECGKGFSSVRALSGHMRCHSIKSKEESTCKKCGKEFDSMRAMFGHMRCHSKRSITNESDGIEFKIESDYKPPFAIPKKRLRTKYKVTSSNPSSSSNVNASSSSVVTDTNEVEEVAMCLMMLSRGMENWDEFSSVKSGNDSVMLEAQSLLKNCEDYDKGEKEELIEKMNYCVSDPTNVLIVKNSSEFCLLDSGSAIDGENKAEVGISVDDSFSCDKLKNPMQAAESVIETGPNQADSSYERNFNTQDLDLGGSSLDLVLNNSDSKREYKCRTCQKIFSSHRALGGHRASHKTLVTSIQTNLLSNFEANFEVQRNLQFNENPIDGETSQVKNKDHECSICFKVFSSGQALGGHKRAHYIGLTDQTRAKEPVSTNEELLDNIHKNAMFDLNVPPSLEDEAASHVGFKPWWVEGDREYFTGHL